MNESKKALLGGINLFKQLQKTYTIHQLYCLFQLPGTSHIPFLFKPKLNQGSASLFSAFSLITVILHLQIILDITIMVQAKVNRELTSLGADLTSTDVHKEYLTCSKSKVKIMVQDTKENNVLPQELCHNDNEDELTGAATILRLLSPPTDTSNSQQHNKRHRK